MSEQNLIRLYRVSKALERQSERIAKGRVFEGVTAGRSVGIEAFFVKASEAHTVISSYAAGGQRGCFHDTNNTCFRFLI